MTCPNIGHIIQTCKGKRPGTTERVRTMTDMNKGYSGYSMSVRALEAYEDGEAPKSKWTKDMMVAAIAEELQNIDRYDDSLMETVEKFPTWYLFRTYFYSTSWHHTSKYCNETVFYGIDESAVKDLADNPSGDIADCASLTEARKAYRQAQKLTDSVIRPGLAANAAYHGRDWKIYLNENINVMLLERYAQKTCGIVRTYWKF